MTLPVILILAAFAAVMILGPLIMWLVGLRHRPHGWQGKYGAIAVRSGLAYVIAFNLTFFIQELFLVVPKAFVPGLRPRLFHNNHDWEGSNPLAELFQGTGCVAILVSGFIFLSRLDDASGRSATTRLFTIWMAYHGLMQGLPQLAVGAILPGNDTGRAMDYLGLPMPVKYAIALFALALVPQIALRIGRAIPALAPDGVEPRRLTLIVATLPAIAAIPIILLYRIPREAMEVLSPPILVTWIGIAWMQAGAWRASPTLGRPVRETGAIWPLAVAAVALLAFFQLVLRRGIPFF